MSIIFKYTEYPYRGGILKDALIKLRGNKCEDCGLTIWKNQPIPLEAHHIDGDKCNNTLENLQLLCPNCHTLTSNYGIKNKQKQEITDEMLIKALQTYPSVRQALFSLGLSDAGANYERVKVLLQNNSTQIILKETETEKIKYCPDCGKRISLKANRCAECAKIASRYVERPTKEILQKEVFNTSFTQLAKKYKVSDKTITKWCKYYNLPSKRCDIKKYSYEEWIKL